MKCCSPQHHAGAVVIWLFTQCLLTSRVCWSAWLVTHPDSAQEVAKVAMRNSHCGWQTLHRSLCLWNFLKLLVCPGFRSLPRLLNLLIINMDETWGGKTKRFESNKVPSGSVGTTLDVLLSSVSYTALRGNESWYHASEWLNHAESLLSLDS